MRTVPSCCGVSFGIGYLPMFLASAIAQDTLDPGKNCYANVTPKPYVTLREADVMWEKRVWRIIDLKEHTNVGLFTPQGELAGCMDLNGLVKHGLLDEGSITAYDPGPMGKDDQFKTPFDRNALRSIYTNMDTLPYDPITRIMIKEDWIFDNQRSEMVVRIIGMAFMTEIRGDLGELRGYAPLFWLYYPECRLHFARWAHHFGEDGERYSFETIFAERRFTSTITKVSNVFDRNIFDHRSGLDVLRESEAIQRQLIDLNFDLWNY